MQVLRIFPALVAALAVFVSPVLLAPSASAAPAPLAAPSVAAPSVPEVVPFKKTGVFGKSTIQYSGSWKVNVKVKGSAKSLKLRVNWGDGKSDLYGGKITCYASYCVASVVTAYIGHLYETPGTYRFTVTASPSKAVIGRKTFGKTVTVTG